MITLSYASVLALMLVGLSVHMIRGRRMMSIDLLLTQGVLGY